MDAWQSSTAVTANLSNVFFAICYYLAFGKIANKCERDNAGDDDMTMLVMI